jgi:endonuclease/exonuclease/phosphatase family metal-dependent hydrolase
MNLTPNHDARLSESTQDRHALRFMTYNAFQSPHLDYTENLLVDATADVYCLQELVVDDFSHPRRPRDQAAYLAERLGLYYHSSITCRGWYRHAGSAILSRYEMGPMEMLTDSGGHRFGLATTVYHPTGPFSLICAHFTWVPRPVLIGMLISIPFRTAEMRQALQWVKKHRLPGIIAGDFNALPYGPEYHTMATKMVDCTRAVEMPHRNTRPTFGLPAQLDYIFSTPDIRTRTCRILHCSVSDHQPLVAELELPIRS